MLGVEQDSNVLPELSGTQNKHAYAHVISEAHHEVTQLGDCLLSYAEGQLETCILHLSEAILVGFIYMKACILVEIWGLTLRGLLRFFSFSKGSSSLDLFTITSIPWLFTMAMFFLNLPMIPCA